MRYIPADRGIPSYTFPSFTLHMHYVGHLYNIITLNSLSEPFIITKVAEGHLSLLVGENTRYNLLVIFADTIWILNILMQTQHKS